MPTFAISDVPPANEPPPTEPAAGAILKLGAGVEAGQSNVPHLAPSVSTSFVGVGHDGDLGAIRPALGRVVAVA